MLRVTASHYPAGPADFLAQAGCVTYPLPLAPLMFVIGVLRAGFVLADIELCSCRQNASVVVHPFDG